MSDSWEEELAELRRRALAKHEENWKRIYDWRNVPLETRLDPSTELLLPRPENLDRLDNEHDLNIVLGLWESERHYRSDPEGSGYDSARLESRLMTPDQFYLLTLSLQCWADRKGIHLPRMWDFLVATTPEFFTTPASKARSAGTTARRARDRSEIERLANLACIDLQRLGVYAGYFDITVIGDEGYVPSLLGRKANGQVTMSLAEIATACDVTTKTVTRWIKNDILVARKIPGTRNYRIDPAALDRHKKKP